MTLSSSPSGLDEGLTIPLSFIMEVMKEKQIKALLAHAQGDLQKHLTNVEIYLENPVGIGEHSDIMAAIEHELNQAAIYEDQINLIQKYLKH